RRSPRQAARMYMPSPAQIHTANAAMAAKSLPRDMISPSLSGAVTRGHYLRRLAQSVSPHQLRELGCEQFGAQNAAFVPLGQQQRRNRPAVFQSDEHRVERVESPLSPGAVCKVRASIPVTLHRAGDQVITALARGEELNG